jgi:hypothetical protein
MKKLKLDAIAVESFATTAGCFASIHGTMYGHGAGEADTTLTRSCPTNYCVTIPVTCPTFEPTCVS